MKRPAEISLFLVPLVAAACMNHPAPDPCLPQSYVATACEYAVQHQGYFSDGVWYPQVYSHPYLFYSGGYSTFISSGGRPAAIDAGHYAPTSRGGFGGSAAAHASAGGVGE
jgi:hypothetical protein